MEGLIVNFSYIFLQSMEPLTLDELKSEKCPRISAEDLLELGELGGNMSSRSPTRKRGITKPMLLVIDVRPPEEYPLCLANNAWPCFQFNFTVRTIFISH